MSLVKIPEIPGVVVGLDGTELMEFVQGGVSKQGQVQRIVDLAQSFSSNSTSAFGDANGGHQINGGMDIDQIHNGNSFSFNLGAQTHVFLIDAWKAGIGGTAVITFQQVTDAPPGLTHSLKMTVNTPQAVLGPSDVVTFLQPIEGLRVGALNWGTQTAQPVALAFWVKAHRPGSYSGSVKNAANDTSYPFIINIIAADTWQYFTVLIPPSFSGTWPTTNQTSLYLVITVAAGSSFHGAANVWNNIGSDSVSGTFNGIAQAGDTFQLTGVAFIPGSVAPTFYRLPAILRTADQELKFCYRYYRQTSGVVNGETSLFGYNDIGQSISSITLYPVPMASTPVITKSGTWATNNCSQPSFIGNDAFAYMTITQATALGFVQMQPNGSGIAVFDARLN